MLEDVVANGLKLTPSVLLSIVNPVSVEELSVQVRYAYCIDDVLMAAAVKLEGAVGATGGAGVYVTTVATLLKRAATLPEV